MSFLCRYCPKGACVLFR